MKNKNLKGLNHIGHEQLFAELNPAEASLIEGGATLCLDSITCSINEEARLVVDGREVWCGEVKAGEEFQIDRCISSVGAVTIELYDGNCFADGQLIGSSTVTQKELCQEQPLWSGFQCELRYRIFPCYT